MKVPYSRKSGFMIVTTVYIVAAAAGIIVYSFTLPVAAPWLSLLIADAAATVFVYLFSVITGNASVYDPYWSVQPPVICATAVIMYGTGSAGILLFTVISIWAVRLTANWAYTFRGLGHQDWRYTMLREKTGRFYQAVSFLGIHMVPTLIVFACALPAAEAVRTGAGINAGSAAGAIISLSGTALESFADASMHRFRAAGTGGLIRDGLWKYSRHPNYLGEILMWWGVAVAAASSMGFSPVWFIGAAANTLMFIFISIPMADKRQSAKPGYGEYYRQTRMLLPLPKVSGKQG